MPNDTVPETTPQRVAAGQSSMAIKLAQAAALAALLVPLGTVAVETSPFSCGFGTGYTGFSTGTGAQTCSFPDSSSAEWDWGPYSLFLRFIGLTGSFFITIDDSTLTDFESRDDDIEEIYQREYSCLPIVDPGTNSSPCREFLLSGYPTPNEWTGYEFAIQWDFPSDDPSGLNIPMNLVAVVHDITDPSPGNPNFRNNGILFDEDMCIEYGCGVIDPEISSSDTDFSGLAPVSFTAVPEPATLVLMATGVAGLVYRRRRWSRTTKR